MRIFTAVLAILMAIPAIAWARQTPPPPPAPPRVAAPPPPPPPPPDLGKWWKNSQVARDLQLSNDQIKSLEQIFLENRSRLNEIRAELHRQESLLQPLLDADSPDPKKIEDQTDQVLAVRGKLEKANTAMLLAFRQVLSTDQWKKLQAIQRERKTAPQPLPPAPPEPPSQPVPPLPPEAKEVGKTASGEPIYSAYGLTNQPKILRQPLPQYTLEAREKKIEGLVLLQLTAARDGTAQDVKVIRGLGFGLDESAISTVTKEWQFRPGTIGSRPVNVRVNVELSFRLH